MKAEKIDKNAKISSIFIFFWLNICTIQKKAVLLHPLLQERVNLRQWIIEIRENCEAIIETSKSEREVAQLVAHYVRDVGVGCSSHLFSTQIKHSSFDGCLICIYSRTWFILALWPEHRICREFITFIITIIANSQFYSWWYGSWRRMVMARYNCSMAMRRTIWWEKVIWLSESLPLARW